MRGRLEVENGARVGMWRVRVGRLEGRVDPGGETAVRQRDQDAIKGT